MLKRLTSEPKLWVQPLILQYIYLVPLWCYCQRISTILVQMCCYTQLLHPFGCSAPVDPSPYANDQLVYISYINQFLALAKSKLPD